MLQRARFFGYKRNYLGFCRLMKWYFYGIQLCDGVNVEPLENIEKWTKVELIQWLRNKNYSTTGTKVNFLERIQDFNKSEKL